MTLTDRFIDGLLLKAQDIPESVVEQAKRCLLDYVGVLVGGMRYLKEVHPELVLSAPNTAFLHGFAAHVLELDDGHRHGMIHLEASIISAILEVAGKENLEFQKILRGIVIGYEAAVRCAISLQPGHKMRGFHVSGTCGTIGSAVGIAFACDYNKNQLKSTLACAISSSSGLLEIQEDASELKPFNIGRATLDGIVSAQIGRLALSGPDDILGGKRGFFAALTDTPKQDILSNFSTEDYCISGIYQKVHAACRHCHPAIDAVLDIRNDIGLKPEQVERIEVNTYKLAVGSHDHKEIRGVSSAKLSTPFSVALAIVKGSAGYADYDEKNLNDYTIKNLTRKVHVKEDENLTQRSPSVRGARVDIYLKNGDSYEALCLYPKGEPEHPLTQDELESKFRGLAHYGGMNDEHCNSVIDAIKNESFTFDLINDFL